MEHTEVTAEVVTRFDRLFNRGTALETIVRRLGITPYVARLLAQPVLQVQAFRQDARHEGVKM
jgi:hypothetical protein